MSSFCCRSIHFVCFLVDTFWWSSHSFLQSNRFLIRLPKKKKNFLQSIFDIFFGAFSLCRSPTLRFVRFWLISFEHALQIGLLPCLSLHYAYVRTAFVCFFLFNPCEASRDLLGLGLLMILKIRKEILIWQQKKKRFHNTWVGFCQGLWERESSKSEIKHEKTKRSVSN